MQKIKLIILSAIVSMAMLFQPPPKSARMLIPLYIYPSSSVYNVVVNANTYENIDVILNPSNGVGASKSTAYVNGIIQLKSGRVGTNGYVYTSYGARPSATVKSEIDRWKLWYGVSGIFLDEVSNTSSSVPYYTDLYNYIKSNGMSVIINPGAMTLETYTSISDLAVIYESDPTNPLNAPQYSSNYPASKFGALQYSATVEQMRSFVLEAKSKNIGYVFVTNDILNNPWDSLPPYLAEEAALLANGSVVSTNTPTPSTPVTPTSTNIPVTPSNGISFAVIGDFGGNTTNEEAVANQIKTWGVDFILTTGDNNYPSGAASTIDTNIGKYYHEFIGNYTGAYGVGSPTNRFWPSIGNHDHVAPNAQPYIDYFSLPGNEYYYDFIRGDVHFFAIDHYVLGGTNQNGETGIWLKNKLASSTSRWNVVYFHASPYTSGVGNGSYIPMRWPFAAWGADVVITGHEHSYERLFEEGIVYFVNGSGGQGLYAMGSPIPGSQVRYNALNGAMLVNADSTSMRFRFINKLGVTIDDYTLGSVGVTPVPVTMSPTSTEIPKTATFTPSPTKTPTPTPTSPPTVFPSPTMTCVDLPDIFWCYRLK